MLDATVRHNINRNRKHKSIDFFILNAFFSIAWNKKNLWNMVKRARVLFFNDLLNVDRYYLKDMHRFT